MVNQMQEGILQTSGALSVGVNDKFQSSMKKPC
jgi:hypothetical protein